MRGGVRFEWGVGEVLVCVGCVVLCRGDGWVGLFIYYYNHDHHSKKTSIIYPASSPVNRSIPGVA